MTGWRLLDWGADLGFALVHSLWQVALVSAALWAALTLLHRASPRLRFALAYGALLLSLAWPTVTLIQARTGRTGRQTALVTGATRPRESAPGWRAAAAPALPWIALAWTGGALLLLARLAGGWRWLRRMKRATEPAPEWVVTLAGRLARRMALPLPDLRVASDLGPFSYGLWRTCVVLPAACLIHLEPAALEAILAHEFAHLRRRDYLFNGLQSLVEVLLFHHPLARWISAAARLERERCCDEMAVAACGDPRLFASALARLDDLRPPTLALAAQGAPLMIRLRHLLGAAQRPTATRSLLAALLLASFGLAAALPLAQSQAPARIEAPAGFVRLADAAARRAGVDPHLVRAMIQCESRFQNLTKPNAMGSVGLMQLIPTTAARFGVAHPEDPEENIRGGVAYLRFLLDRYHGDTAKAVVAYNAGEEALDRAHGIAPTEESRAYAIAVLDLAARQAVVPAEEQR